MRLPMTALLVSLTMVFASVVRAEPGEPGVAAAVATPTGTTNAQVATLPQSSADLVARLFADRGWSGSRSVDASGPGPDGLFARVTGQAATMVSTALDLIGVPYRRGGSSAESGFDCSGFTRRVFASSVGLLLPRRADEQARAAGLKPVDRERLQPGDLVFFNTLRHTFSHVGIYLGDNKFIHSPRVGSEVRVDDMRYAYWSHRFTGGRRADLASSASAAQQTGPAEAGAQP